MVVKSSTQFLVALLLSVLGVGLVVAKWVGVFSPYPGVMPDELTYMSSAFFPELDNRDYGNAAHSVLYGRAAICGAQWYSCVKGINLLFELLYALIIVVGMQVVGRRWLVSLGVGLASLAGPFLLFSGNFMPESMQAFLVAAAFVGFLLVRSKSWPYALAPGLIMGFALLTKPHGIVIVASMALVGAFVLFGKSAIEKSLGYSLIAFAVSAFAVRSLFGFILSGIDGLNPFASYLSIDTLSSIFGLGSTDTEGATSDTNQEVLAELSSGLGPALISALTNITPGILILSTILLAVSRVTRLKLGKILSQPTFLLSLLFFVPLVLLSSAFGAYLELQGLEQTQFRTMTRYWEYAIPFLIVGASLVHSEVSTTVNDAGGKIARSVWILGLLIAASSAYLLLIPRFQTLSDSSLARHYYVPLVAGLLTFVFAILVDRNLALPIHVSAATTILLVGSFSILSFTDFQLKEKSGYDAGARLYEHLTVYPADDSRVVFVGGRIENAVAAFTAKLPTAPRSTQGFYEEISYSDFDPAPRFIVASPEVFVNGPYRERYRVGDSIFYEFGYPETLGGYDLEKYGVASSSALRYTYWGAWIDGASTTLTLPEDFNGDTLQLMLIVNQELDSRLVTISYGGVVAEGELEPEQTVTPVTLRKEDGSSWAGEEVTISYPGATDEMLANTITGYGIGIDSLAVFSSSR